MRTNRRLLLTGAALAASLVVIVPRPAPAQWSVSCVNCGTIWNQIQEMATQVSQYTAELQQLQQQIRMYTNMVQNTVTLPSQAWGTAQSDIMQVQNIASSASILSGNASGMIGRLSSVAGYSASTVSDLTGMANRLTMYQQTLGNGLSSFGQQLGLQSAQQQNNAAILTTLQAHALSAQGQMQALQAGNELAGQSVAQLQQIQATMAATGQLQASALATQADRQAQEDAAELAAHRPSSTITVGGGPKY